MTDIQMMRDQIEGMIAKGKYLRCQEADFLKLQGLKEETDKTRHLRDNDMAKLDLEKATLKELKDQKREALAGVASAIAQKMSQVLPVGEAVFEVDDSVFFGWNYLDTVIPYDGLSGGQKQIFDTALAHVLDANILVLEAGELDDDHLYATLEEMAGLDHSQIIINTCHPLKGTIPEPFTVINVGGA